MFLVALARSPAGQQHARDFTISGGELEQTQRRLFVPCQLVFTVASRVTGKMCVVIWLCLAICTPIDNLYERFQTHIVIR
jgi:hypothetical protein